MYVPAGWAAALDPLRGSFSRGELATDALAHLLGVALPRRERPVRQPRVRVTVAGKPTHRDLAGFLAQRTAAVQPAHRSTASHAQRPAVAP